MEISGCSGSVQHQKKKPKSSEKCCVPLETDCLHFFCHEQIFIQHKPTNSCLHESLNSCTAQVDGEPGQHCWNSWIKQVVKFCHSKGDDFGWNIFEQWWEQTNPGTFGSGRSLWCVPISSQKCSEHCFGPFRESSSERFIYHSFSSTERSPPNVNWISPEENTSWFFSWKSQEKQSGKSQKWASWGLELQRAPVSPAATGTGVQLLRAPVFRGLTTPQICWNKN